jgi:hypothetical protein
MYSLSYVSFCNLHLHGKSLNSLGKLGHTMVSQPRVGKHTPRIIKGKCQQIYCTGVVGLMVQRG